MGGNGRVLRGRARGSDSAVAAREGRVGGEPRDNLGERARAALGLGAMSIAASGEGDSPRRAGGTRVRVPVDRPRHDEGKQEDRLRSRGIHEMGWMGEQVTTRRCTRWWGRGILHKLGARAVRRGEVVGLRSKRALCNVYISNLAARRSQRAPRSSLGRSEHPTHDAKHLLDSRGSKASSHANTSPPPHHWPGHIQPEGTGTPGISRRITMREVGAEETE